MKIKFINRTLLSIKLYGEIIKTLSKYKTKCYIPNNNTYPLCKEIINFVCL